MKQLPKQGLSPSLSADILSCEEHDRITAAISHVPHIIAVTLVNMVRENDNDEQKMKSFAAGGFKDITRIASSSPAMWQDICMANKESIDYFLTYFQKQLQDFQAIIREEKGSLVYDKFEEAGTYRRLGDETQRYRKRETPSG